MGLWKKTDSTNIRKALDSVNWDRLFDKKDLNSQFETTLNVFRNCVPNKYVTDHDKDPKWMNEIIKSQMEKKTIPALYIPNGRFQSDLVFTESLIAWPNDLISYAKDLCYENLAKKKKKVRCCKPKHTGQSFNHFITTEKSP